MYTLRALFERIFRRLPHPFEMEPNGIQSSAGSADYLAIREALVNLLVHQDYSDRLRTARVLWYDDRAVFEDPGDSFLSLPEMLDGGAGQLRNPLLARMFRLAGFAEHAGTGIPNIVRTWRKAERVPPEIENDPGRKTYRLVLQWRTLPDQPDAFWRAHLGVALEPDAARVLDFACDRGLVDRTQARLAAGLPGAAVTAILARLVTQGLLEPAEDTGDTYRPATHVTRMWTDARDAGEPVGTSIAPVSEPVSAPVSASRPQGAESRHPEEIVRRLVVAVPGLRVPEIARRTGLSPATVKRVLKALRVGGDVAFTGSPRTGGYHALTERSPATDRDGAHS